jgi:biotin synthase
LPLPGTPLAGTKPLVVSEILRALALYRLILPEMPIRLAAGRESALVDFLGMAFMAGADGMMIGGYLTQRGRRPEEDQRFVAEILRIWTS